MNVSGCININFLVLTLFHSQARCYRLGERGEGHRAENLSVWSCFIFITTLCDYIFISKYKAFKELVVTKTFTCLYQFPRAAVTKHHKVGRLKQQTQRLTVLQKVPSQGNHKARLPSKTVGEVFFVSGCLVAIFDVPWPVDTPLLSCHMILFLCVSVFTQPSSYKHTSHTRSGTPTTPV